MRTAWLSTAFSNYAEWAWFFLKEFTKVLLADAPDHRPRRQRREVPGHDFLGDVASLLAWKRLKQGWAKLRAATSALGEQQHDPAFLGDNNGVAIGMFMLMPLCMAPAQTTPIRRNKLGIASWASACSSAA